MTIIIKNTPPQEWTYHPDYPVDAWSADALCGDMHLGYSAWVEGKIAEAAKEKEEQEEGATATTAPLPPSATDFTLVQEHASFKDFERYPMGYGADGLDRTERITWDGETGTFYASAVHQGQDGREIGTTSSARRFRTWEDALAWLEADALEARADEEARQSTT